MRDLVVNHCRGRCYNRRGVCLFCKVMVKSCLKPMERVLDLQLVLSLQRKCEEIGALESNHYSFRITDDLISRFSFGVIFDYLEIKEKEFWKNQLPSSNVRRN